MYPLESFRNELAHRKQDSLLREILPLRPEGPFIWRDGKRLLNFTSNDYLDLARHPALVEAATQAARQWGMGSTGSRLVTGGLGIFTETEEKLAHWKQRPRALYFNNGYAANLSLVTALTEPGTQLFFDRLDHASFYDGARMSGAPLHRFRHNDPNDLERLLKTHPGKGWIFTESVYSMDGDLAPLRDYAQLSKQYQVGLVVDEAHADGLFGPNGRGLVHELGLENDVDVVMGTLGKALGCAGATVWADPILIDWLINNARPLIYSTAQSPAVLGAVQRAIDLLSEEPWRRQVALERGQQLRTLLQNAQFDTLHSQSQIIPVILGDNARTLSASQFLAEQGFWAAPIRQPTVPPGTARLRINVNPGHRVEDLEALVAALVKWRAQQS